MDRAKFFDALGTSVFGGALTQSQNNGLNSLLDACEAFAVVDSREVAYILATPMIETGGTYAPISENLNYNADGLRKTFPKRFTTADAVRYAHKQHDIANRAYANRNGNGNEASGDGWFYRGRGYPQITGRGNYAKFSDLIGVNLVANPDLAMVDEFSAKIIVVGMRDGLFTGKKLADYFTATVTAFVNARHIINGTDRADDIAAVARKFLAALEMSR